MDTGFLLSTVLNGVLGARTKRSHRASHYLTGGLLSNPAALMTAAGLAWGAFETYQKSRASQGDAAGSSGSPAPETAGSATPSSVAVSSVPPPLPTVEAAPVLTESVKRLLRLAISAANADGAMNEHERAAIFQQAAASGVPEAVIAELNQPLPLAEIVAGVTTAEDAATMYVLAFTVVRADEQLTTVERIYLAQLAHLLHLDEATAQALEQHAGERIDALGDQGQPGG
jgi:uncharacterized membrane protein YebE (DUF533 family)